MRINLLPTDSIYLFFWEVSTLKKAALGMLVLALVVGGCAPAGPGKEKAGSPVTSGISRRPSPLDWSRRPALTGLPSYNPDSGDSFQVDLRHRDTSKWDLTGRLTDLLHAAYDTGTVWPEVLPEGFNPARQMELARNPGLGVRTLHSKGITGKGIGIAIIDQELLVDHVEYKDNLKHYEELGSGQNYEASMHGPAVASIAVGKTVGVAPAADLYFIRREWKIVNGRNDFTSYAAAVDRVVEINEKLPAESRIRVLSMAIGWGPTSLGYDAIEKAVKNARDHGIFVISTSLSSAYGLYFHGLGRDPRNDPEIPSSYGPGSWWAQGFYRDGIINAGNESLLVPMDSRCTAGPSGPEDYAFYAQGGWSWCVPYIAGLYAMACQVKPNVTPEGFWKLALATGDTVTVSKDGREYQLGKMVNSVKLIEALQRTK